MPEAIIARMIPLAAVDARTLLLIVVVCHAVAVGRAFSTIASAQQRTFRYIPLWKMKNLLLRLLLLQPSPAMVGFLDLPWI